jgi:SRSO17 transposase
MDGGSIGDVTPEHIEQIRPRLEQFAGQMLEGLPRSDQRAKGELYVRGLLTDGARKSMQPMAQRLGVDHQGLQQFITSSTWDYTQVRANVATWAVNAVGGPPVLRHAGQNGELPDRGQHSDGHRSRIGGRELAAVLPHLLG